MPMLTIFPGLVFRYLFGIAIVFDGLSFLVQLPEYALGVALPQKIVEFLNVGGEYNPQAWYSSLLLSLCSLLLLLIAIAEQERRSNQVGYWRGLALIFIYLSMDEMLLFHERVGELLSPYVQTSGIFRYAWVVLAIPICLVLGVIFLRFLVRLPRKIRQLFLASAAFYVGSALLLEMVEGFVASIYGEKSVFDFLLVAIEECLEKFAKVLFIYALLVYIGLFIKTIDVEPC